jgi:hypothetical protein
MLKHALHLPSRILGVIAVGALGILTIIGSGGGGSGNGTTDPVDVAGIWNISEQINDTQCGRTGDTDNYNVTVTQNGSSITVVSTDGTFSGSVSGNKLSWTGQYYSNSDGVWITLTSMSLTINGDSLSGSTNWEARNTQNGAVVCTGTTQVTGNRTSGGATLPDAPTGLIAQSQSASSIAISWTDNSTNEQSFLIERAAGSPNNFAQVATAGTNVTSYTDMNLSPSTTYYYQVRASNSSGFSAYSNIAQATTSAASQTPPAAPTGLTANALTSSSVQLNWTDVANNEDGYRIERGLNVGSYSQVAQVSADSTTYTDSAGIEASTHYYYRVVAYNSAGDSATTTDVTTPAATVNYTLTVNKSGSGSGTVTGTGINCGADCTHTAASGSSITLAATADSGSAFSSWTGCTTSSGASCTVNLTNDTTVTAAFNIVISTSITLSLPTTSTTGNYTLSWTVSGLAASNWPIQEDSDTNFSNPTAYISYDTSSPYTYAFTNKPDGTYCYRARLGSLWSDPACITVARPTSSTLHIVNNTKYDMIYLTLNNVQKISYPYGILAGGNADFVFTSGGTVNVGYGVGFYNSDGSRNIWFNGSSSVTLTAGQTYTLTVHNPSLGDILSGFSASRNWDGTYYCYSCPILVNYARFNFTRTGNWTFYDNGVQQGTGAVILVSWPTYGSIITFKVCTTCDNIQLAYPFGIFYFQNGPPDWPTIEYVAQ